MLGRVINFLALHGGSDLISRLLGALMLAAMLAYINVHLLDVPIVWVRYFALTCPGFVVGIGALFLIGGSFSGRIRPLLFILISGASYVAGIGAGMYFGGVDITRIITTAVLVGTCINLLQFAVMRQGNWIAAIVWLVFSLAGMIAITPYVFAAFPPVSGGIGINKPIFILEALWQAAFYVMLVVYTHRSIRAMQDPLHGSALGKNVLDVLTS